MWIEKALNRNKNMSYEFEKEPVVYKGTSKIKRRTRTSRTKRPDGRSIIRVVSPSDEIEARRKQLERHLSDLRALHEPDDTLIQVENFLDTFEPQTKEEEMLIESIWKQLEIIKEKVSD